MTLPTPRRTSRDALRFTDCAGVWLGLVLVAVKASFLGLPWRAVDGPLGYAQALLAITYTDVAFAAVAWALTRAAQWPLHRLRP